MALFHFTVDQMKRSEGQSAIASAAYRSGERLYSEYYGEYSDYTRKGGVICSDILLPSHAPPEFADRQTLWNAVEQVERGKKAQLAYSFEIALQNEFTIEENIALARQFLLDNFVSRGMTVDVAFHEKEIEDGGIPNPHFHFLCPMRPMNPDGTWGFKQHRVYRLDEDGNRIRDQNGKFLFDAVPTTDWGDPETLEQWRKAWADVCNAKFAEKGLDVRIDHRSYERQGINQIPTVHLGVAASAMEKRGIRTGRGDLNREIEVTNQKLRQLKARISKLQNWLKEEAGNTEPPTLADYIQGILSRKAQAGKTGYSQSLYNLKDAAKMLNFLQTNNIMDMAGLDEKFKSMIGEQLDIQGKLKPVERRLATLKKHLEQADIYFKCKGKKPLTEAEQILFTTAKDYLKGVMNGKTTIPTKTWKEEYTKLTAERKTLNQRYLALKEEVKEAEKIRKSVYSILRQEQREQQPHRKQDVER